MVQATPVGVGFVLGLLLGLWARDVWPDTSTWQRDHGELGTRLFSASSPPKARDLDQQSLCVVARAAAVSDEVLLLIGDSNVFQPPDRNGTLISEMLYSLLRHRVNNILLIATDDLAYQRGQKWVERVSGTISLHVARRDIPTPGKLASRPIREQMSAKKFEVLRNLLVCNVHVLLTDFDVVFWGNPFSHLVRDSDLEAMTDGWDNATQYGWEFNTYTGPPDNAYRWFAPWQSRIVFLNSGFFYIQANERTVNTMEATWDMLTNENIWDQAAFNLQVLAPRGTPAGYRTRGQSLTIRVMEPYKFSNSRVFNELLDPKSARSAYLPTATRPSVRWPTPEGKPVALHVNYHLHKVQMLAWARTLF